MTVKKWYSLSLPAGTEEGVSSWCQLPSSEYSQGFHGPLACHLLAKFLSRKDDVVWLSSVTPEPPGWSLPCQSCRSQFQRQSCQPSSPFHCEYRQLYWISAGPGWRLFSVSCLVRRITLHVLGTQWCEIKRLLRKFLIFPNPPTLWCYHLLSLLLIPPPLVNFWEIQNLLK